MSNVPDDFYALANQRTCPVCRATYHASEDCPDGWKECVACLRYPDEHLDKKFRCEACATREARFDELLEEANGGAIGPDLAAYIAEQLALSNSTDDSRVGHTRLALLHARNARSDELVIACARHLLLLEIGEAG